MIMPKYILIASGSVSTPRLDIVLSGDNIERARKQAEPIVKKLVLADYFAFDLFELSEGKDTFVEAYRADIPEPEFTILNPMKNR